MHDALRRLAGLALTASLLGGCANAPSFFGQQSPEQLLVQAQQQPPAQAATTRLQAADILSRQGEHGVALSTLTDIDPALLSPEAHIRWSRLTAEAALAQHNPGVALKATALINDTHVTLSTDDRRTLTKYRADAYGAQGDHLRAANLLLDAQRHDGQDAAYNDALWTQLTALSKPQLNKLTGKDDLKQGWSSLTQVQMRAGNNPTALQSGLDAWKQQYPGHPAALQLPAALAALLTAQRDTTPAADIQRIAVFLPESGALLPLAKALKDGINAQRDALKATGKAAPEVTYYNATNANLDDLYAQATLHGDQVVIGPLDKDMVTALEARPNVPLPTLALNYGNNPRNTTQSLYEYGLSAEDEARQVAQYAHQMGLNRAAIMVPDNDWGARVQEAFRQQWQVQGGSVLNTTHYAPNAPVSQSLKQAMSSGTPDLLFLLALPNYGRQVPPTLKYQRLGNLPIYATSHIYTGAPNPSQDSDLNGIAFPDIPWYLPELSGGIDQLPYKESYTALTSNPAREGGIATLKLNAMGVDALELSRQLTMFDSVPTATLNGATGTLRLGDDHRFQRQLPWARFQQGRPAALSQ